MIDITPADQEIVKTILKKHVPHAEVRVFGSRHKWTAKPYSDLDLAIVADAKLDKQLIYDLEEAFEESELSFRVDVIDWYAISDEFRAIIEQGYTVIQEKKEPLPTSWMVKKLGDVCSDISYGYTASANHVSGSIKFLRITDIQGHVVDWFSVPYCEIDETRLSKYKLEIGDLVVARTGNTTGVSYVMKNDILAVFASYLIRFRFNPDILYWRFADYVFRSKMWFDFINGIKNGSSRDGANARQLSNYEMMIPPLEEQKEIAAILSSLDDKIGLNLQINKKLKEMAQAIFKEWFIEFNFSDENGNPYRDSGGAMIDSELGQIPASWSVGKLGEEFNITMGQSPVGSSYNESKEGMIFFQGRTDFGTRFPSIRLFTTEPKRIAKKFDILLSVRAPVGDINIALQDCCIGRGLAAINAENKSYCYYKLQFLQQQFNIYNGTGTVFGAINKDQLHGLSVVIATQNVVRNFEDVVSKIDEKIYHNHLEILSLQNTRDTLLPKLISGKIKI